MSEYHRLQEQKTAILKDWHEKPSLLDMLDDFSSRMARVSAKLIRYRAAYAKRLERAAIPIHADFSGGRDSISLSYQTVSSVTDPLATEREIYYEICEHQERHRRFASQGQTRTAALSLKLAEREIFREEFDEYPVLMLDDVLSELDSRRQAFVLNRIGGGQTLITCCEGEEITSRTGGKVFFVENGSIR